MKRKTIAASVEKEYNVTMRYARKSLKSSVFFIAALMALGGCRPTWVQFVDPSGTPEYTLGWEDGCDSGLSAEGDWTYKVMFGFKKRPEMAANDQYKQGWNEGFSYCRFSLGASKAPGRWEDIGMGSGF